MSWSASAADGSRLRASAQVPNRAASRRYARRVDPFTDLTASSASVAGAGSAARSPVAPRIVAAYRTTRTDGGTRGRVAAILTRGHGTRRGGRGGVPPPPGNWTDEA